MNSERSPGEFVRLLVEHQFRLYTYILSLVPNYSDADDVMQETSIALWEMFDQFQQGSDFASWACSVAHYRVLKYRKKQAKVPLLLDEAVLEQISQQVMAENKNETLDRQKALQKCVGKLASSDRQLLEHTYDPANRTLKQVADLLGRPVNTVYKAVSRIHRALFACVQRTLRAENSG